MTSAYCVGQGRPNSSPWLTYPCNILKVLLMSPLNLAGRWWYSLWHIGLFCLLIIASAARASLISPFHFSTHPVLTILFGWVEACLFPKHCVGAPAYIVHPIIATCHLVCSTGSRTSNVLSSLSLAKHWKGPLSCVSCLSSCPWEPWPYHMSFVLLWSCQLPIF